MIKMIKVLITTTLLLVSLNASAGLIFTVDTMTTDELSISIRGTFDADTIGNQPGYLSIINNWSNTPGIHTEIFNALPSLISNSITIGGISADAIILNDNYSWTDAITFQNPFGLYTPILAGTEVMGSFTLKGVNIFNTAARNTLELVSGFNASVMGNDLTRLEASSVSVPEPGTMGIFAMGMFGFCLSMFRQNGKHKA